MKKRTKIIAVGVVAVLAVLCTAGIAFAADGAVPGDALYDFDRAVESIGIGDGGLQERLAEATALANKGETEKALSHVAAAVSAMNGTAADVEQANAALLQAANAVQASNQGESEQIRARVAEMLRWMAGADAAGSEFGQQVATRAQVIAGEAKAAGEGQMQSQMQNMNGDADQTQSGALEKNQNGALDETQNQEQEQNQSGDCDQTQSGALEKNQNGALDETQNQEQEQNQSGDCDQTQTQTSKPSTAGKR